jgi:arginase
MIQSAVRATLKRNVAARSLSGGAGYGNVHDRLERSSEPLFQHTSYPHTCRVIGAPMTYGQPYAGTDGGPELLRERGLLQKLSALGWRVHDHGDLEFAPQHGSTGGFSGANGGGKFKAKNSEIVGQGCHQLADLVEETARAGQFPLVLGGDHSIGLGTLSGLLAARPETGVIWVDAHADLNAPDFSESGNMHGMPLGLTTKGVAMANPSSVPGLAWLQDRNQLDPSQLVYIGLRDIDPAERQVIKSLNIKAFTMHEIDRFGIGRVMEEAFDHLLKAQPDRPLHLSYDIDALDPLIAPATGTTVRGGLTYREAHYVAEAVAYTGLLASAEIVELNPFLSNEDGAAETVDLGMQLITSFMGKAII